VPARKLVAALLAGFVLAACNGAPASTSLNPSGSPKPHSTASVMEPIGTAEPTPNPTTFAPPPTSDLGPATATFDIEGDPDVAGEVTFSSIRCGEPSFDNTIIDMDGKTGGGRSIQIIFMRTSNVVDLYAQYGRIKLTVSAGSGPGYTYRTFVGDEVYGFDAFGGGTADYVLTERIPDVPGKIGKVGKVEGDVHCNNQGVPGTSTIVLSGPLPGGLKGRLSPVNVQCFGIAGDRAVSIIGLAQGDRPYLVTIHLAVDGFAVDIAPRTGAPTTYQGKAGVTLSATGATVNGDGSPAGAATPTLHLAGDATCAVPFSP
jgi:hypothetical protein